jgi:hypothetical protein
MPPKVGSDKKTYTIVASINLAELKIEKPDNGRGQWRL